MSKNTTTLKPTNGKSKNADVSDATVVAAKQIIAEVVAESAKPVLNILPEPAAEVIPEVKPEPAPRKELTLLEKILKVENLQLIIEKRAKLVQTRSELERFQISSNDFNCSMRLNDSDGNVFTTSFTPGVKKVIDFLKSSFDGSISEAEEKINF
jgi:hypothetical protein